MRTTCGVALAAEKVMTCDVGHEAVLAHVTQTFCSHLIYIYIYIYHLICQIDFIISAPLCNYVLEG